MYGIDTAFHFIPKNQVSGLGSAGCFPVFIQSILTGFLTIGQLQHHITLHSVTGRRIAAYGKQIVSHRIRTLSYRIVFSDLHLTTRYFISGNQPISIRSNILPYQRSSRSRQRSPEGHPAFQHRQFPVNLQLVFHILCFRLRQFQRTVLFSGTHRV